MRDWLLIPPIKLKLRLQIGERLLVPPIKLKLRLQIGERLITNTTHQTKTEIANSWEITNTTHQTKTGFANRWETSNRNPPGPIKLSSQLTCFKLCWAFYQSLHPSCAKMLVETHLLSQARIHLDLQDWTRNGHRILGGMNSCCELFGHGVFVGFASPFSLWTFLLPK